MYVDSCAFSISPTQVLLVGVRGSTKRPPSARLCSQGCQARECSHLSLRSHQVGGLWLGSQTQGEWQSGEYAYLVPLVSINYSTCWWLHM